MIKGKTHSKKNQEAIKDVTFKHRQATMDLSEVVSEIKTKGSVTRADYRLLTGACRSGIERFLEDNGLADTKSMPIKDVLKLTEDAYGGSRFAELMDG